MKTIVIYHKADFDGIFCREIAKKFLPQAELIGWDYNDPVPVVSEEDHVYMLDISIEVLMNHPNLIWIDHHKSAIEKFQKFPVAIQGYRIDGVAACRLAWQWFQNIEHKKDNDDASLWKDLPNKQDFSDRKVIEPLAVKLAGEYDIWDKRDPDAELFQHGLRSEELYSFTWDNLLDMDKGAAVIRLLNQGRALQYAKTKENASIVNKYSYDLSFEGLNFLACNHAQFNSLLFTAATEDSHDALLGFNWSGEHWRVSLYHAPGKEHHDLSLIAVKYGGGGHKGACGFILPMSSIHLLIN